MKKINIGICGWGNVATGLYKAINKNHELIKKQANLDICIKFIGARRDNPKCNPKGVEILRDIFDVTHQDIDVVVELIGGVETARELILSALKNKKHVITANKAVIFQHGDELFNIASKNNIKILYESAVCAGTPVIKVLREELAGNNISKISGMLNGTTNFILSEMEKGADFDPTLAIAQKKGYAEPDPSFDIDGIDAAHKIGILSYIAHGTSLPPQNFYIEGISDITSSDFKNASDLGYVIKHLAVANQINDSIELRAHPALIRKESILASLQGVRNGIEIDTDLVGKIHITGSGAGQESTASGLVSDIIHLSNNNIAITDNIAQQASSESLKEFNEILFKHYFSMEIEDEKEINQKIFSEADNNNIKIEQIISNKDKPSNIYFITNLVKESEASNLLNQLKAIGSVKNIKRIRIESE